MKKTSWTTCWRTFTPIVVGGIEKGPARPKAKPGRYLSSAQEYKRAVDMGKSRELQEG